MTQNEGVKLAVVVNDVAHIKEAVSRIETALTDHVEWEAVKYDDMEKRFAPKKLEHEFEIHQGDMKALNKEVADLPSKLKTMFANIWTEHFMKGVLVSVIGALIIAAVIHIA